MAYVKQVWTPHVTPLDAAHMSHIEDGIAAVDAKPGFVLPRFDKAKMLRNGFANAGGAWTRITGWSAVWDVGGLLATPDRITVKTAGDYRVDWELAAENSSTLPAGACVQASVYVNGASVAIGAAFGLTGSLNGIGQMGSGLLLSLAVGAYIELYIYGPQAATYVARLAASRVL